ncbi:MAG TPA: hypothetical protein VHO24_06780 [Opitutaceae bacterium]|nr:hypothetical protein [Opitutaceae bacterium]
MKNLRRVSLVFAACFASSLLAAEGDDAVLAVLKPVADAALRGDFAAGIDVMYDPLAQDLGGKPKLVASIATLKEQLAAQQLTLVRQEFVPPLRFVQGAKRRYVLVPTITEMQSPGGLMRSHGFQLGVEVSPGTWQFVDGAQVTRPLLGKYFSDFPANEKLPELRRETVEPPIGGEIRIKSPPAEPRRG